MSRSRVLLTAIGSAAVLVLALVLSAGPGLPGGDRPQVFEFSGAQLLPQATRPAPSIPAAPGNVAVCDEPGEDEILRIDDEGAPGGEREIWVRRPPGPDRADMPVLYLLHGSTTHHTTIRDADIGPLLDAEMCRTGVEFVIAAPHGQADDGSDTEWGDDVDGSFRIETFVTETAIEEVEGENRRDPALRAIGGFSMGGYGSAALALRHPELYSQVVSWAGYFRVDDPSGTFGPDPDDEHAPDHLIEDPGTHRLRFMLIEGEDDRTPLQIGSIHGEAERFAEILRERDVHVETLFPPGGHTFDAWTPTLDEATDFLVNGWQYPAATS
ncbi:alpha/beta hydrolase [Allonocardiopsis opalescens]|uniref:S-formylglutathione hydrolase FrmB n=1 Tax=Allonocardiopsis opalescens TaxID=1144618 RepID=A0A2T0QA32_9ACTN|nr:alpha/beta hydrolase-fold protein [Allonocardiopsis opalescens]PRY00738.1 S-formylglutathione hydrolase FrmB [Allonocardiopsis opalescens]